VPDAVAQTFGAVSTHVRLVVLNAYYSASIEEDRWERQAPTEIDASRREAIGEC